MRFVNDRTEYQYAVDIALRLISGASSSDAPLLFAEVRDRLLHSTQYMVGPVYVASFSDDGDDLNQWRAYSFGGTGFCVGFDRVALCKAAGPLWTLSQCLYDDSVKDALVTELISPAAVSWHTRVLRRGGVRAATGSLQRQVSL